MEMTRTTASHAEFVPRDMGSRHAEARTLRRHVCLLVGLCALFWAAPCGLWDLRGPDECRYVQVSRELLENGNAFALTLFGKPYDQKPPLAFWTIACMLKLCGGVSSWAARMPAVIAATCTVLLALLLGRRASGGNPHAGLASALILLTTPLFAYNAPQAELNVPYTFWTTLSLSAWLLAPQGSRRFTLARAAWFWLSLAAAFFTKGPLALLIVSSVLAFEAWSTRSWTPLRMTRPLAGIALLCVLIGGWLWAEMHAYGTGFVAQQIGGETIGRLLHGSHAAPFWFYLPRLFVALFPWIFVLMTAAVWQWRRRRSAEAQALRPYVAWALFPFIVLCLAHGKRQSYLLPLLPAVSVIAGCFTARVASEMKNPERLGRIARRAVAAAAALALLFGVLLLSPVSNAFAAYGLTVRPWMAVAPLTAGGALLLLAVFPSRRQASGMIPFHAVAAVLLAVGLIRFAVVNAAMSPSHTTRPFATEIDKSGVAMLGAVGRAADPELHVYGKYRVKPVAGREIGADEPSRNLPRVLLVREDDESRLAPALTEAAYAGEQAFHAANKVCRIYRAPDRPGLHFALLGDTGTGGKQIRNVVREMAKAHGESAMSAVFLLGDNMYKGTGAPADLNLLIGEPFAPLSKAGVPLHAILGNHDYHSERLRAQLAYPLLQMNGQRYCSKTFGDNLVTFFLLDSESLRKDDSTQLSWFKGELASCRSVWKILLLHRPLAASQIDHGPNELLAQMLGPLLNGPKGDIDLVISGHNHVYERRNVGRDGVLHLTVGNGGQLSRQPFRDDPGRACGYNAAGCFGQLWITEQTLEWRVTDEHGKVVDNIEAYDEEANGPNPAHVVVRALQVRRDTPTSGQARCLPRFSMAQKPSMPNRTPRPQTNEKLVLHLLQCLTSTLTAKPQSQVSKPS